MVISSCDDRDKGTDRGVIQDNLIEGKDKLIQGKEDESMKLSSPDFNEGEQIPDEYTCRGADVSPALVISDAPADAKSLVLIMDDPDAVSGIWDHWIVFNIPPDVNSIEKGNEPSGVGGKNSWGKLGYGGPCPPSGTHRYIFKLYSLDTTLDLPESSSKTEIENAMKGHILEETKLTGTVSK